ncbi:MAG: amidohydrolase family protein, partial [Dehalococcoidales bacterium]|nr:amidohydrolase family protein [Dehalococcoidales bacterium]
PIYFCKGKWTCRPSLLLNFIESVDFGVPGKNTVEEIERGLNNIGCRRNTGNQWLQISGVKLLADGIPPLKTAWMYEEYVEGGSGGLVVKGSTPDEQEQNLREMIRVLHKNRFRVAIHSCGERSVDICIDQYMQCIEEEPWDARHYVIHADFIRPETIRKVGEFYKRGPYKVGINIQSAIKWTIADVMIDVVGPERAGYMWPVRSMLDAGIRVTDSSDAAVTYPNFLHGIQAAVLRESKATGKVIGKDQIITVPQALANYTINGAWQEYQEHIKGSIEVGKLADFCVLSGDILTIEPHKIKDLRNTMTMVGGRIVYEAA